MSFSKKIHITIQAGVRIPQVCIGIILNLCLNSNLYMCRVLLTTIAKTKIK